MAPKRKTRSSPKPECADVMAGVVAAAAAMYFSTSEKLIQATLTLVLALTMLLVRDKSQSWKQDVERGVMEMGGLAVVSALSMKVFGSVEGALVVLMGLRCADVGQACVVRLRHVPRMALHGVLYVMSMRKCEPCTHLLQLVPQHWSHTFTVAGWEVPQLVGWAVLIYVMSSVYMWRQQRLSTCALGGMLAFDAHLFVMTMFLRNAGGCGVVPLLTHYCIFTILREQLSVYARNGMADIQDTVRETFVPVAVACAVVGVAWPVTAGFMGVSAGDWHSLACTGCTYFGALLMQRAGQW